MNIIETTTTQKQKRTRKPWVYRADYERLQDKKNTILAAAYLGWVILALYVTFDILT